MGDLNNTAAARVHIQLEVDPAYQLRSFPIPLSEDDAEIRKLYRPFLLDQAVTTSDWVSRLELSSTLKMVEAEIISKKEDRLKVLVLYGSLRSRFAASPSSRPTGDA